MPSELPPVVPHNGKMADQVVAVPNQGKQKKKKRQRRKKSKKELDVQKTVNTDIEDNLSNDISLKGKIQMPGHKISTQGNQVSTRDNQVSTRDNQVSTQATSSPSKSKNRSRKKPDRYYGRFCCKICRKSWESAFVFTRAGTKKVLFKQRCKNCDHDDAWVFPYRLELLRCSQCQSQICECLCEQCGKMKHFRYIYQGPDDKKRAVDDSFEYCDCEKRSTKAIGQNIQKKKPHLSQFCQKCLSGYPCTLPQADTDDEYGDNEP